MKFDELNIDERILRAVEDMGFEETSPIQTQAIPAVLEGIDVIGQAQTGTGKTAAYSIPMLQKINPDVKKPQAIVLCPTRELAVQVAEEIRKLAKYMSDIKVLPVYGGQEIVRQIKSLKAGVQIIVGTPGRVMDHMRRKTVKFDSVSMVILDEADEMLDMGFREDMETILTETPEERQTVLFSATMPKPIMEIARKFQKDAKIIKVVRKELTVSGNYTDYASKKAILRNMKLKEYLNQQRNIKHQEEVIAKLKQFNREKSIKRAESREKMLDKIEVVDKPVELNARMNIKLEPSVISGNDVLTVTDLTKSFDGNTLFNNINFEIKRGERVALIGNNGTGKTTILKLINGIIPPDSGSIYLGAKVAIGYYDQEHHVLDPDKTLFQEIQDAYPDLNNTQIRNTLAAFLFTDDDVFKYIRDLSGGERGRVSLAKLMLSNANLLILDEPTNHLDIVSKEILENALNSYTGTILYVSHDRYFINATATRIIELTNRNIVNYIGNYDYYLEKRDILTAKASPDAQLSSSDNTTKKDSKLSWQQSREEQNKLKKKQNEIKKTEIRIAEIEDRLSAIDTEYSDPSIGSNTARLMELHNESTQLKKELDELYEHWEELMDEM
jgi:ABC-type multidrug transport system ATPase subunit